DVIVLMKVGSVYGRVWKILEQHQLLSHSYVVEHATRDNQVTYTDLKKRPSLKLPYFSIMIVKQAKIGIAGG
ncbi:MAG: precorrin-2 C(20)-methyltransferase, partial [Cyanobacteria bacterium P01_C01_bin.69]